MKRFILLTIAMIFAMSISAQKINIVGTWEEVDPNQYHNQVLNESIVLRTWIFSADGTKTLKGRQQLTYPIGGINCTFDLVQSRTDEKWTLNGNTLTMVAIPLNKLTIDVDYQKYGNYTAAQKQKINAGIPAFKQLAIKETRQGWQSFVGHISTWTIRAYNPKQMVLVSDGQAIVLVRDLTKMTAVQKAQFNKELAEYEAQIQKEKEMHEAEKREASDVGTKVFSVVEVMPQFPGGQDSLKAFIASNVVCPEPVLREGVNGRVVISFVVQKDGLLRDFKAIRCMLKDSLGNACKDSVFIGLCEAEALRVSRLMPRWKPGTMMGNPVDVKYNIPFRFNLPEPVPRQGGQVKFHDVEANQATGPVKSITTNAFGETRTITFSLDGKMQGEDIIDTKYDANGYLQSVKRKVPQGQATITYKWENGKIVSLSMDIIGQQTVTKRTYNEKGAPASESINMGGQDIQTPFTDYKYDNHGNWISRKVSMMGDEMEQTRIINYYE